MSIGIYKIYFKELKEIYIGQSCNVEHRWKSHLSYFRRGHYNSKLAKIDIYVNTPLFSIIEICSLGELNSKESLYIEKFNSFKEGFNLTIGGREAIGRGIEHPSCNYTKEQILKVIELLMDDDLLSYSCIGLLSNVHKDTVANIVTGRTHYWIQEELPESWELIQKLRVARKSNNKSIISMDRLTEIQGPDGTVYLITNITEFAKVHNLSRTHISSVLNGKRKSTGGFTLPK